MKNLPYQPIYPIFNPQPLQPPSPKGWIPTTWRLEREARNAEAIARTAKAQKEFVQHTVDMVDAMINGEAKVSLGREEIEHRRNMMELEALGTKSDVNTKILHNRNLEKDLELKDMSIRQAKLECELEELEIEMRKQKLQEV